MATALFLGALGVPTTLVGFGTMNYQAERLMQGEYVISFWDDMSELAKGIATMITGVALGLIAYSLETGAPYGFSASLMGAASGVTPLFVIAAIAMGISSSILFVRGCSISI